MSFFLLIIGTILVLMGRIDLGSIRATGRPVKAAGLILLVPGIVTILFGEIFIPLAFGRNTEGTTAMWGVLDLFDLVGSVIAMALAYILLVRPANMPRLPGILGEIQEESAAPIAPTDAQPQATETSKTVVIPQPSVPPKININRDQFPSVMNLKQAARYLQTTEEEILNLINEGKLVAARDNYNYQIAKSQLDELL